VGKSVKTTPFLVVSIGWMVNVLDSLQQELIESGWNTSKYVEKVTLSYFFSNVNSLVT